LQHTATHCNTLQHAATRCNTLQHAAAHCNTLQHAATRCNSLQHVQIADRITFAEAAIELLNVTLCAPRFQKIPPKPYAPSP